MNINDNNFEIEDEEIKEDEGGSTFGDCVKGYLDSYEMAAKQIGIWEEVKKEREKALEELANEDMSDLTSEEINDKYLHAVYGTVMKAIDAQPKYKITNLENTVKFKKALKLVNEAVMTDYNKEMNNGDLRINVKEYSNFKGTSSTIKIITPVGVDFSDIELKNFIEACSLADVVGIELNCFNTISINLQFDNTENVYFESNNPPSENENKN